jgi:hypothetical protein
MDIRIEVDKHGFFVNRGFSHHHHYLSHNHHDLPHHHPRPLHHDLGEPRKDQSVGEGHWFHCRRAVAAENFILFRRGLRWACQLYRGCAAVLPSGRMIIIEDVLQSCPQVG